MQIVEAWEKILKALNTIAKHQAILLFFAIGSKTGFCQTSVLYAISISNTCFTD